MGPTKNVLAHSLAISFGMQFNFRPPVVPSSLSSATGAPFTPQLSFPLSLSVQSIAMPLLSPLPLVPLLPFLLLPSHLASVPPNPFRQSCVHPLRVEESRPSPHFQPGTKLSEHFSNGTKAHFTAHSPLSGFVASDGYPNGYENQKCSLELVASPSSGLVVHLSFVDLDLESPYSQSEQCLRDYIVITIIDRDGREHTSERICGAERPKALRTMQSRARILFIASSLSSNGERTQKWKGFRMKFEFVPECHFFPYSHQRWTIGLLTNQRETDRPLAYLLQRHLNGVPFVHLATILAPSSFYYDTDRKHFKECGGTNSPTELSGEIHSPGFPSTYPRNVTCNWLLRVAPDHRIHIRLLELELSSTFECERASLQFSDGFRHEFDSDASLSGFPLRHAQKLTTTADAIFCGGSAYYQQEGMKSFLSERNRVFVRFTAHEGPTQKQFADHEAKRKPIGFRLIWTEVESLVPTAADDPRTIRTSLNGITRQSSFVVAEQCAGFMCSGGEFCVDATENICVERMRLCINESLRCDGMPNCAENDDSDESFCYMQKVMTLATIVPLVLVLSLLLALFCFFYCIWKLLRKIRADRNEQKPRRKETKRNNGKLGKGKDGKRMDGMGRENGQKREDNQGTEQTTMGKEGRRRDGNCDRAQPNAGTNVRPNIKIPKNIWSKTPTMQWEGRESAVDTSFGRHKTTNFKQTPKNGTAKFVIDDKFGSPCICRNRLPETFCDSDVWTKRTSADEMCHGNVIV